MAQIVKLRRSAVGGQKPTNTNLQLGELAINTTDGKVFLAKSGSGGASVEELISTNTVNTGSINLIGDVTASNFSGSFKGDGSGITNVVSSSYAVTSSYSSYAVTSSYAGVAFTIESTPGATKLLTISSPSTTWYFNHNLGEQYPVIQVYDSNGFVVIPTSIEMFSEDTAIITFSLAQSGYATATVGGGLPAISSSYNGRILQTDGVGASWNDVTGIGLAITGSNTFNGNQTINGSLDVSGLVTLTETTEVTIPRNGLGTGTNVFSFTSGSIFYMTGMTGNSTFNITDVPTTTSRAITVTFVIEQGVTPYSGSAYQINGASQTVKWADGIIPTGTASSTDVIGLSFFRNGSTWNVLGSLASFRP
jgi:hypothetical protein